MTGEFEMYKDDAGQYQIRFQLGDETFLCSYGYKSKLGCTNGIESVRNHSSNPDYFVKDLTVVPRHRFKLISSNGRVLGFSRVYETMAGYGLSY